MRPGELVDGRVARLDVRERVEQLGLIAQLARNRAQSSGMLWMSPPRVVPATVGMGDERQRGPAQVRTGRLLRCMSRNIEPSRAPASARD